jgi:hypothetical protein
VLTLRYAPYGLCRNVRLYIVTDSAGARLWTGSNKKKAKRAIQRLLKKAPHAQPKEK